jgi:hypothetical protein
MWCLPSWGVLHRPSGRCFPGERHYIAPIWALVELCTSGEGPRGHEAPHHDIIPELVPNRVCVVWAGFLDEPLEVVRGQPCLTLVAVCDSRGAPHARVACLSIVGVIVVSHGHGSLEALLMPLFATHDALPTAVDGDVRRCSLGAAWGCLPASLGLAEHDTLIAGGVLGCDVVWLLKRATEKVAKLALERAPCTVLGRRAHAPLVNLGAGLGFAAPALSPHRGLGRESSGW